MKAKLHTSDIVRYSGEVWKVVTTINGRKADLQRLHGTDPRMVTILTDNLEVIKRLGRPITVSEQFYETLRTQGLRKTPQRGWHPFRRTQEQWRQDTGPSQLWHMDTQE